MDKKMYFEPEMEVVNLKLQGMLCASGGLDEGGNGNSPKTDGDFDGEDGGGF